MSRLEDIEEQIRRSLPKAPEAVPYKRDAVSAELIRLATLHEVKEREYGDAIYKSFGSKLLTLLGEIHIRTASDWGRVSLLILQIMKIDRYIVNFHKGGHSDSLSDLTIYAQLLAELDRDLKPKDKINAD